MERASFLVYYSLYRKFPKAAEFRKVFRYQHAAHVLKGLSADDALIQVGSSDRFLITVICLFITIILLF